MSKYPATERVSSSKLTAGESILIRNRGSDRLWTPQSRTELAPGVYRVLNIAWEYYQAGSRQQRQYILELETADHATFIVQTSTAQKLNRLTEETPAPAAPAKPRKTNSAAWVYQCPIPGCNQIIRLFLPPSLPPTCSGLAANHSTRVMTSITQLQKGQTMATKTAKTKAAPKAAKEPTNECQCNAEPVDDQNYRSCGRLTRGRFAPGHDAKLKGALIRCTTAGIQYKVEGQKAQDPQKVAASLGWGKYTDRALEIKAEKATKAADKLAAKAAAKKATTKKVPAKAKAKKAAAPKSGSDSLV